MKSLSDIKKIVKEFSCYRKEQNQAKNINAKNPAKKILMQKMRLKSIKTD